MPEKVVFFMASLMSEPLIEPAVLNASRNSPAASYARAPIESGASPNLAVYAATKAWTLGAGSSLELSLIHISEPTRLGMISYAVFCLKKKKKKQKKQKR